jgi:hypothetical protein
MVCGARKVVVPPPDESFGRGLPDWHCRIARIRINGSL